MSGCPIQKDHSEQAIFKRFFFNVAKKNHEATSEKSSTFFLFQSISMAIHLVCVMGCPKNISTGLEGLFNFQVPI